jgi:hypothetical protein
MNSPLPTINRGMEHACVHSWRHIQKPNRLASLTDGQVTFRCQRTSALTRNDPVAPRCITANFSYDEWPNFLGNRPMAEALLSRLRHSLPHRPHSRAPAARSARPSHHQAPCSEKTASRNEASLDFVSLRSRFHSLGRLGLSRVKMNAPTGALVRMDDSKFVHRCKECAGEPDALPVGARNGRREKHTSRRVNLERERTGSGSHSRGLSAPGQKLILFCRLRHWSPDGRTSA